MSVVGGGGGEYDQSHLFLVITSNFVKWWIKKLWSAAYKHTVGVFMSSTARSSL